LNQTLASMRDVGIEYRRRGRVVFTISGFDLDVVPGRIIHLRGASGSGKSSVLRVLAGLQRPTHGTVFVGGESLYGRTARDRALLRAGTFGFVFQSVLLLPMFDSMTNVMIPRLLLGGSRSAAQRDALSLMERFDVAHRAHHRPHELSGGEQRRIALARALINHPPILIADEPFADLDENSQGLVWGAINGWVETGRAVIIASHVPLPPYAAVETVDMSGPSPAVLDRGGR
jgi:ABC-type lipoprotein export system ATPase subunit